MPLVRPVTVLLVPCVIVQLIQLSVLVAQDDADPFVRCRYSYEVALVAAVQSRRTNWFPAVAVSTGMSWIGDSDVGFSPQTTSRPLAPVIPLT